jgi:hypothetical protein
MPGNPSMKAIPLTRVGWRAAHQGYAVDLESLEPGVQVAGMVGDISTLGYAGIGGNSGRRHFRCASSLCEPERAPFSAC